MPELTGSHLQGQRPPTLLATVLALLVGALVLFISVALSLKPDGESLVGVVTRQGTIAGVIVLMGISLLALFRTERHRWWGAALLLVVVTPVALAGFWFSPGSLGISDWDYYFSLHETYRRTLLTHHTFPLWNAATCGGTSAIGDPEFPVFTPTFLLELLFGIPVGLRLAIYVSVIVGSVGMLFLGRRLTLSPAAAFAGALGTFFGSVNLLEIVEGHVNIFAVMWIPWILWAWLAAYRAADARRSAFGDSELKAALRHRTYNLQPTTYNLACGLFLALTFFQGGVYLLFYTLMAFVVLSFLVSRPRLAVRTTVVSGLWALGLAAVKLVPVLFWLGQFPDETYAGSAYTLPWLGEILLGRHLHGAEVIPNQGSGWHEYGAYVGPVLLVLALIGAAGLRRRVTKALVVGALLAMVLSSSGPALKPLFDVVPYIPRSNISRVILFAVIPLALLAGIGTDRLRGRLPRAPLFIPLLVAVMTVDLVSVASPLSEQAFILPEVVPDVPPVPPPIAFTLFRYPIEAAGETHTRAYAAARAGYGTLTYCSVLGPKPLVKTIHDEGDTSILTAELAHGRVELLSWSPNRVQAAVTVPAATTVILNTNYARGWLANGLPAENANGRVAVPVSAGAHAVTFEYRPEGFLAGLLVTLGTGLGALAMLRKEMVRRRTLRGSKEIVSS